MGDPVRFSDLMAQIADDFSPEKIAEREERWAKQRAAENAERAKRDAEASERNKALEVERLKKLVPPSLAWVMDGSELESESVVATVKWLDSDRRGLMLRGGVGSGKSVGAAVALRSIASKYRATTSWHRPNDLVSAVLHSYDENAPKLGRSLVVIDDVGRETKADFGEALCSFIDDTDTRFVITTNLKKDEFRARYDERLVDRLNDCARAVTVKNASMRKKDGGF